MEERVQRAVERLTIFGAIRMVALVAITLAAAAALLEWLLDPTMGDLKDASWWAIVTVTTVGYGDVIPTSSIGRVIASILMVAGVSAIPITTSLVVSIFVARAQAEQREHDAKLREDVMARLERIEQALAREAGAP